MKIEQMYAKSLVTVFDECIIVNLTADYYVNCQKDTMWKGIPEQGDFGEENRRYAETVVHPADLEQFNRLFSREAMLALFKAGKRQVSARLRRLTSAGTYHMVEFTAARIDAEGSDEYWGALVFRDVQEEFLTQRQQDLALSQLATAVQTAYQMLIAVNLTKNTYNMLEYERFPVSKPGVSGDFSSLIEAELATVHPDYQKEFFEKFSRRSLMDAYGAGERIITMEVPHLGSDGIYHWYFTQVVRVESPSTDDMLEITLSRNIDEERRQQEEALQNERRAKQILEDALQRAEKASQAKSDFLSRMSHDIRTPMNAILGMTELAQLHTGDRAKTEDYLEKIRSSGVHLLGLINEVLDVSKIESGTLVLSEEAFDLRDLAKESVELVRLALERRKQNILVDLGGVTDFGVTGDAQRLKQVLVNILDNASKYTPDEGRITFRLEELDRGERKEGTYRFTVEDNGIGMEEEYLKHMFEPFSRAADSRTGRVTGTGLGMTIVKNLVTMMGGDIRVNSEYGKGTRFAVTLCLKKDGRRDTAKPLKEQNRETDFSGLRILLAEDNELNRQIAAEMLTLLGAKTEVVTDGRQAADAVYAHPVSYYDLVFMDVQMPVLNGYDAVREIRNSGMEGIEDLLIIAMTADAFAEDVRAARLAGMNGHLTKPISIERLKTELSRCAEWKQSHSGTA